MLLLIISIMAIKKKDLLTIRPIVAHLCKLDSVKAATYILS